MSSSFDRYDARFLLDDPTFSIPLQKADAAIDGLAPGDIPKLFDAIPIDVFALLALHQPDHLANLARWLPIVPPDETQIGFVGSAGQQAFLEAAAFLKTVETASARGGALRDARILDYGIGWARLSRLLYKYTSTENLYGVDAWLPSLNAARDLGFRGHLGLVDAVPAHIPFDVKFDVVLAFSVLTHVSRRSADAIGKVVADALQPNGVFVLTIRPANYAEMVMPEPAEHLKTFSAESISHTPDQWAVDGGISNYGTTTIAPDYFRRNWPGFDLLGTTINAIDPFQMIVVLQKK